MALGWLALLKVVPWTDVLAAAPQVAGGARKLWDAVGKKSPAETALASDDDAGPAQMKQRIDRNEATLAALHGQMLSATQIITTLADQNTVLVAKIEDIRIRLLWVGTVAVAAIIIAAGSLIIATR